MKITQERERKTGVDYVRVFEWRDEPGAGFSFPSDKDGNPFTPEFEAGRENLALCLSGDPRIVDKGVQAREWSYMQERLGVCCRTEFDLEGFTNTCPDCGSDYNWAGQLLAHRSQWGEETGESLADILNIP